jgi:hypothetical protein
VAGGCISVAALLQLCCSSVAALLQLCCSSVAALLQLCCGFPHFLTLDTSKTPVHSLPLPTSITSMLDTCMHAPYVPLLDEVETCKACAATELQQSCNRAATELQQSCNRAATEMQQSCNRAATELHQICNRDATELQQSCNRAATQLQHSCNTAATQLQHSCNRVRRVPPSSKAPYTSSLRPHTLVA